MFLFLMSALALAEILITSPSLSQNDAKALSEECLATLTGEEHLMIRISRFFVKGEGYRYKVVISGFSELNDAENIQERLIAVNEYFELQSEAQVYKVKKEPTNETVGAHPASESVQEKNAPAEMSDSQGDEKKRFRDRLIPEATDVLSHAQEAHEKVSSSWVDSDREHFAFSRKLPQEGMVVKHEFYRLKEAMRLEITVEKGAGTNSTTVLPDEGEGWVQSNEKRVSRNAIRTKELLERFSSQNILSVPFYFSEDVKTSSQWRDFTTVIDGGDIWLLVSKEESGLVEASFHKNTWLLNHIKVVEGQSSIEYEFQDYRGSQNSGKIPHLVQIYNDEILTEEIQISVLNLDPDLPLELFSKPSK